jgi:hypothetical protein
VRAAAPPELAATLKCYAFVRSAKAIGAAIDHAAPNKRRRERSSHSEAGWSCTAADLKLAVGDDASSRENPMVEIRVSVPDAAAANGLLARFAALFERSAVSFDAIRNEVRVRSEWESRSVVAVIDAVQSWLATDAVDSAELSLGDRSYTMAGPTLVPQNGRAAVAAGRAA